VKGIILAGGTGSRLFPSTIAVSKQLIPIYDKPMIYYPLSTLLLAKITEILIITTPEDLLNFKRLLGDGSQLGISIEYATQSRPEGLAQAFLIGEKFIGNSSVCLILGDNIFYGHGLPEKLQSASNITSGARVFGYYVSDPERYGVAEIDENENVISIAEKPKSPISNWAITGIYFYGNDVIEHAKKVKPSLRGELEITSINQMYLENGKLSIDLLGRGYAWLDTGTNESLLSASEFIATIEKRQGLKISCPEEIALNNKLISKDQVKKIASKMLNSDYGKYLLKISS
jgi:glucose-1-phosphate thymidylyltransferase